MSEISMPMTAESAHQLRYGMDAAMIAAGDTWMTAIPGQGPQRLSDFIERVCRELDDASDNIAELDLAVEAARDEATYLTDELDEEKSRASGLEKELKAIKEEVGK